MSTPPPPRSLEQALAAGPLSPAAGTALADDLLAQLAKLHAGGAAHGFVRPGQVRLQPDGSAALLPAPAPGPDRGADVRAVAELVCAAIGIAVRWSPSEPLRETERAAPALAATLRALAQGTLPLDAAGARAALQEAAGGLAEEGALAGARAELAVRAGAPRPAQAPAPAPEPLVRPIGWRPRRRPVVVVAAIVGALLVLGGLGALGWSTAAHRQVTGISGPPHAATPAPTASASPLPLPSVPTANGSIKSVVQTPQTACAPGSRCRIEVDVHFVKAEAPEDITWQFELVDGCTSEATYVEGATVHALTGWVHVVGDSELTLPAGHPLTVVAITTKPSHAASAPLLITTGSC